MDEEEIDINKGHENMNTITNRNLYEMYGDMLIIHF